MIIRFSGVYTLSCDICDEESLEMFDDFYEAVEYKKANGWRSQRDEAGDWQDVCPNCQNDWGDNKWD